MAKDAQPTPGVGKTGPKLTPGQKLFFLIQEGKELIVQEGEKADLTVTAGQPSRKARAAARTREGLDRNIEMLGRTLGLTLRK